MLARKSGSGGDEGAKLILCDCVEHDPSQKEMDNIE
jgi:hypothetical protein